MNYDEDPDPICRSCECWRRYYHEQTSALRGALQGLLDFLDSESFLGMDVMAGVHGYVCNGEEVSKLMAAKAEARRLLGVKR